MEEPGSSPTLPRWYVHSVGERFPLHRGGTQLKDREKLAGLRLPHTCPASPCPSLLQATHARDTHVLAMGTMRPAVT